MFDFLRRQSALWLLDLKHSPWSRRGGILSLYKRFLKLLRDEETAGNDNVFYNPQDLTSLRVETDGSGGNPTVGDPVGMMLDTSGLSGSMEEFLSSQPELVTNGTFDTDTSGWTYDTPANLTVVSGELEWTYDGTDGFAYQIITTEVGKFYQISADLRKGTAVNAVALRVGTSDGSSANVDISSGTTTTTTFVRTFVATATNTYISIGGGVTAAGQTNYYDNISVKEIPGNHAIAPSDAARPTLMDDPDTTWSSLTDDGTRGENLRDSGTLTAQTGWTDNGDGSYSANATSFNAVFWSGLPLDVGCEYLIEFTVDSYTSGTLAVYLGINGSGSDIVGTQSAAGSFSDTFRWKSTGSPILTIRANPDFVGTISGVSVRKVNTAFDERGTTELVTNGDFSDGTTGWTLGTGWSVSNGVATHTGTTAQYLMWLGTVVQGRHYEMTFDIVAVSGGASVNAYLGQSPGLGFVGTVGTYTVSGIATGTALGFALRGVSGASASISVTNISVKEVLYPNLLIQESSILSSQDDDSTFDADTGNWTKGTGWSIGSGVASCDGTQTGPSSLYYPVTSTNKFNRVRFYVSSYTAGTVRALLGASVGPYISSTGWYEFIGRQNGTGLYIQGDASFVGSIDNVIIQELPTTTPTSYYLDTDGVDDWMQVTPTLNLGEQWWHTGGWQSDTAGGRPFATSEIFQGAPRDVSGDWVWYDPSVVTQTICTSDPATKHVLTIEQSDTNSLSARYDGVTEADPITPYDDSGAVQGLALFSQQNVSYSSGINGRFYGGAWGQGQVDYDELTTLQDYLGTLVEPDINPTDVTKYDDVYQMLSAQTAAALFDIDDTTSLRVGTDGSGGVPVDGDPVGVMMDVSGAGGSTMAAYLEGATELVTNGTFDTDTSGWSGVNSTLSIASGALRVTSTTGVSYARLDSFSVEAGKVYSVSADVSNIGGTKAQLWVGSGYGVADWLLIDNVTADSTITGIFTATTANAYLELVGNTSTGQSTDWDNVSIKELPGYVATAPSDAARPTLASVLDETASELTDDGTRGPELITDLSFDDPSAWTITLGGWTVSDGVATCDGTNGASVYLTDTSLEFGATYEVTFVVSAYTSGNLRAIVGDFGDSIGISGTGTYTTTLQMTNGTSLGLRSASFIGSVSDISIKKVQTVFDGRGDELVTNGGFDTDSDWTKGTGWSISGGAASHVAGTSSSLSQNINLTAGSAYNVTVDATASGGTWYIQFRTGTVVTVASSLSSGSYTFQAVAASGNDLLSITAGTGTTLTIDNISVKEVLTPNLLLTSAGDDDSTFDTDTGNWNVAAASNWSITGGALVADGSASNNVGYSLPIIESYKWYRVMLYISAVTGSVKVRLGSSGINDALLSTTGWHTVITQSESTGFALRCNAGETVTIDNVIVQEVPASVARNHYLDFDGVDDNLILDGTDFGSSTNATLYKTFRGDSTDTQQIMFGSSNVTTAPFLLAAYSGNAATVDEPTRVGDVVYREDGAIASYVDRDAAFTALIDNTDHTIGVENVNMSLAVDWVNQGFYIGGEYDPTFDSTGRLYSWAAVDTRLDGRNRDLLENFMISKKTS